MSQIKNNVIVMGIVSSIVAELQKDVNEKDLKKFSQAELDFAEALVTSDEAKSYITKKLLEDQEIIELFTGKAAAPQPQVVTAEVVDEDDADDCDDEVYVPVRPQRSYGSPCANDFYRPWRR